MFTAKLPPKFIITIFTLVELFKIVTFIPGLTEKTVVNVKFSNTLTIAAAVGSNGIQEVRGSIPLVSTNENTATMRVLSLHGCFIFWAKLKNIAIT